MPALINIKNLRKQYGKKSVLNNINLEINKGEMLGIIGMSGSGKTTLLNTIIGFLEPEEGDILYYNKSENKYRSIFKNEMKLRKRFGFATQVPSFYPKLTIEENLDHFASLYQLNPEIRKKNITNLLKIIGLESEKDQLAQKLSGGMEKRLGIACALVHNPEVLILDEPTANLDPVLRDETWELIKNIHKIGTTVIVASHLLEELEPVCQKIAILHNHSMIEVGTPDQLKTRYTKDKEISIKVSGKQDKIESVMKKTDYIHKIKRKYPTLILYTQQPLKTIYELLHLVDSLKETIISLELNSPSLKEVFESIYKKKR
jgi:ABC-2 type transport system ATP-binding protein